MTTDWVDEEEMENKKYIAAIVVLAILAGICVIGVTLLYFIQKNDQSPKSSQLEPTQSARREEYADNADIKPEGEK